jgi:HK97 family phage prohead protease
VYFAGNDDAEATSCLRWCAPVAADQYCDAWLIDEDHVPGWLAEPQDVAEADQTVDALEQLADAVRPEEVPLEQNAAEHELEERAIVDGLESREFDTELRISGEGNTVVGYAARWNVEADGLSFREQIAPGAFRRSLADGPDPVLLVNHDDKMVPLARRSSGTLRMAEDNIGLAIEADLDPANPDAAALLSALRRGDMGKMSFSFKVNPGGESREDGLRTITDANLYEVSVVTWPAYSASSAGVRSAEAPTDDAALRARRIAARIALRK